MPIYQNYTVADAKLEVGNYAMYIGTAGSTAGAITINLGAGMVKNVNYNPEMITTQAGNAVDPIQGVARETMTFDVDMIEYDGSSMSAISNGMWSGTSGSITIGGQVTSVSGKGWKLVNTRKLANGSTQTTTYTFNKCVAGPISTTYKSDNDADPVAVMSYTVTAYQYATAQTICVKTVA